GLLCSNQQIIKSFPEWGYLTPPFFLFPILCIILVYSLINTVPFFSSYLHSAAVVSIFITCGSRSSSTSSEIRRCRRLSPRTSILTPYQFPSRLQMSCSVS